MKLHVLMGVLVLGSAGGACGNRGGTDDTGTGADTSVETPTTNERAAYDRSAQSGSDIQHLLTLADSLFQFDPTIDPSMGAAANAQAIQRQAMTALGTCGTVSLVGTTVTIMAPNVCTLPNGTTMSGTVAITVSGGMGTPVTLQLTFTNLNVNGRMITGSSTFVTSNGTSFSVMANLTVNGTTTTTNLTVAGATGSFTINGTAQRTEGGTTTALTFNNVHMSAGQCYPDSGSVMLVEGLVRMTISFNAMTPTTGAVTVMQGLRSFSLVLPVYGNCPRSTVRDV